MIKIHIFTEGNHQDYIYVNPKHICYVANPSEEERSDSYGCVLAMSNGKFIRTAEDRDYIYEKVLKYKNKSQILLDD